MFRRRLVPDETFTLSSPSLEFHTKPVPIRIDDMHTSPPPSVAVSQNRLQTARPTVRHGRMSNEHTCTCTKHREEGIEETVVYNIITLNTSTSRHPFSPFSSVLSVRSYSVTNKCSKYPAAMFLLLLLAPKESALVAENLRICIRQLNVYVRNSLMRFELLFMCSSLR